MQTPGLVPGAWHEATPHEVWLWMRSDDPYVDPLWKEDSDSEEETLDGAQRRFNVYACSLQCSRHCMQDVIDAVDPLSFDDIGLAIAHCNLSKDGNHLTFTVGFDKREGTAVQSLIGD